MVTLVHSPTQHRDKGKDDENSGCHSLRVCAEYLIIIETHDHTHLCHSAGATEREVLRIKHVYMHFEWPLHIDTTVHPNSAAVRDRASVSLCGEPPVPCSLVSGVTSCTSGFGLWVLVMQGEMQEVKAKVGRSRFALTSHPSDSKYRITCTRWNVAFLLIWNCFSFQFSSTQIWRACGAY